jgi:hypothetical protein
MAINFYCTVVSLLGLFCYKNYFIFNEVFLFVTKRFFLCWVPFQGCGDINERINLDVDRIKQSYRNV